MPFNFDEIIDRKGTFAVKWDAMPPGTPPDAIPSWVADMDFACAPAIVEALRHRVEQRIFGYTLYDTPALKSAVTGWFSRRYGWDIAPGDIFFAPGVVPAIAILINILSQPGDSILVQQPVYHPFMHKIRANGRVVVNSPLVRDPEKGYIMNREDVTRQFADPAVRGMILCNPHNPVGRVWTEDELRFVVDCAVRHDKWIISDEIHIDLTRHGVSAHPLLKLAPEQAQRIVSLTAPTKTFNLAGCQISNIVIPNPAWQKAWNELAGGAYSMDAVSPFGVAATIAAYNDSADWLDALCLYLDDNVRLVMDHLTRHLPLARMDWPEGTYLAWVDLSAYEQDPRKLQTLMQQEAKVAFNQGDMFGEEGAGFIRMNLACPRQTLREVLHRMTGALTGR